MSKRYKEKRIKCEVNGGRGNHKRLKKALMERGAIVKSEMI